MNVVKKILGFGLKISSTSLNIKVMYFLRHRKRLSMGNPVTLSEKYNI